MAESDGRNPNALVREALENHCELIRGMIPGAITVKVDTDIHMAAWECTIKGPAAFHMSEVDYNTNRLSAKLCTLQLDRDELEKVFFEDAENHIDEMAENGGYARWALDEQLEIKAKFVSVDIPGRDWPMVLGEIPAWIAIEEATRDGDSDLALAIFDNLYSRVDDGNAELPRQDVNKPKSHVQGISKLSDKITEIKNGETVMLDMGGDNEPKRTILTPLCLTYEGDGIEISRPVTPYDQEVHNAVATLWAAGNRNITARQVYQTMTGSHDKPRASAIAEVEASLDKQRRTFVTIDFSKELRGKTAEFDGETITAEQCHFETYMLNADKLKVRAANGSEVVGYLISSAPILYRHDLTTRQIISYPQSLLEATSKAVSNTSTVILMRSYLIKRIRTMSRRGSKLRKQIRYDSIYEAIGKQSASRTQRSRMNAQVKALLDVLKSEGFINDWSEYADKGSSHRLIGVKIKPKYMTKEEDAEQIAAPAKSH